MLAAKSSNVRHNYKNKKKKIKKDTNCGGIRTLCIGVGALVAFLLLFFIFYLFLFDFSIMNVLASFGAIVKCTYIC